MGKEKRICFTLDEFRAIMPIHFRAVYDVVVKAFTKPPFSLPKEEVEIKVAEAIKEEMIREAQRSAKTQ